MTSEDDLKQTISEDSSEPMPNVDNSKQITNTHDPRQWSATYQAAYPETHEVLNKHKKESVITNRFISFPKDWKYFDKVTFDTCKPYYNKISKFHLKLAIN